MDRESLRLECLKIAVEDGKPLELAMPIAQQLFQFLLGELPIAPNGMEALSKSVE